MVVLEGLQVDQINNTRARKPIIPHEYLIVELGLGAGLIDTWMEKYSIKTWSDSAEPQPRNKDKSIF